MTTLANVKKTDSSHWYAQDGTPMYTVIAKGSGQPRPTTLADARKLNLLPSVTTILRILHKQGLVDWLIEQACLAVLTTPRHVDEPLDAFVERVLHTDRVQDEESQKARDRGTEIHQAIEDYFQGKTIAPELEPWVAPAIKAILPCGELVATEKVLVGDAYAGKTDLILEGQYCFWIWDFKSAKKLPKEDAWPEHQLQLSAYAQAFFKALTGESITKAIRTANLYISTTEQGQWRICETQNWRDTYCNGFSPLISHWQWATGYMPEPPKAQTQARD